MTREHHEQTLRQGDQAVVVHIQNSNQGWFGLDGHHYKIISTVRGAPAQMSRPVGLTSQRSLNSMSNKRPRSSLPEQSSEKLPKNIDRAQVPMGGRVVHHCGDRRERWRGKPTINRTFVGKSICLADNGLEASQAQNAVPIDNAIERRRLDVTHSSRTVVLPACRSRRAPSAASSPRRRPSRWRQGGAGERLRRANK